MTAVETSQGLEIYRELFRASPDPILLMDAQTRRIIDVNPAAERLYGYTRTEFLQLTGIDVSAEPEETKKDMGRVARGDRSHILVRYHRKRDGTVMPVEISGGSFSMASSNYIFGLIRPLEQVEQGMLREKQRAREVEHRIKNAMATIRGTLWISEGKSTTVKEFARDVGDRVQAMANLHDSLAGRGWGHADLAMLIEDSTLANPQVVSNGATYVVDAAVAIPLGQVFYELHANSLRHGSLSCASGHVNVVWELTSKGRCALRWMELDGPPVNPSPRPGTGTALLEGLVENEIGGQLELEFACEGLQAAITLPLPQSDTKREEHAIAAPPMSRS